VFGKEASHETSAAQRLDIMSIRKAKPMFKNPAINPWNKLGW
tara:strand:+ start:709 stop:834 length:126 start_codon:yes stop_codon:yes gene_type:complete